MIIVNTTSHLIFFICLFLCLNIFFLIISLISKIKRLLTMSKTKGLVIKPPPLYLYAINHFSNHYFLRHCFQQIHMPCPNHSIHFLIRCQVLFKQPSHNNFHSFLRHFLHLIQIRKQLLRQHQILKKDWFPLLRISSYILPLSFSNKLKSAGNHSTLLSISFVNHFEDSCSFKTNFPDFIRQIKQSIDK